MITGTASNPILAGVTYVIANTPGKGNVHMRGTFVNSTSGVLSIGHACYTNPISGVPSDEGAYAMKYSFMRVRKIG